jgi:dihydrofolate reductase
MLIMNVSLIAAVDRNGVIGHNGQIPWYLPEDFKYFRRVTEGKTVLMGRKTFESIGKPLVNRQNIVITANLQWQHDQVRVCHSWLEVEQLIDPQQECMVIGGSSLYDYYLDRAQKLYLTEVEASVEGDCYFPSWQRQDWQLVQSRWLPSDAKHQFGHYQRLYVTKV